MDVRLPDGTVIQNVPEGTTKAQLIEKLRANGHNVASLEAAPQQSDAPKPIPTFGQSLGRVGQAGMRGAMSGGPMGAIAAMAGEGSNQTTEAFERAAYGAGGKVTDALAGKVPPEVAAGAGYATNVATQAVPTVIGGVVGGGMKSGLQNFGKTLMQSALKPSKLEHQSGKAKRAVQTMLDEGVSVSEGGVEKMRSTIRQLNDEISSVIADSKATVSKNAVASRLQDVLKKYETSVDPADLKAVEDVWTKFLTHPLLAGKDEIPIQLAQKMKQAGGAKLGDASYGMGLKPAAERDAYKGIVRGLKEEISAAEPSVAGRNARESDLINATKIAANRVAVDANKNPLGLGALISQPWMLPIWMWDRSPLAKSLTARMLYSGARPIGTGIGAGVGGLYGASQGEPPRGEMYP